MLTNTDLLKRTNSSSEPLVWVGKSLRRDCQSQSPNNTEQKMELDNAMSDVFYCIYSNGEQYALIARDISKTSLCKVCNLIEFSLNVFIAFTEFSD